MKSIYAIVAVSLIWIWLGTFYYPKWNKPGSEAAISWDVSGYYHYLPAIFIYHDLKQQAYMTDINARYLPSPSFDQSFGHHDSGNKVNKYAIGQAVLYAPFFLVAHAFVSVTKSYPADGYSKPYQVAIWLGSLLISIFGLFLLRRILLDFFSEEIVFFVLIILGLGTNWMEYASISNGMNHTWLLTVMCGLIFYSIRFYQKNNWSAAIGIGACLGLAILTRPTEIVWAIVPLLWMIQAIPDRISFLLKQWKKLFVAAVLTGAIVFIQIIYWKYVANEWIVYSYGDQKFNFLHPDLWRGLMGVNVGWLLYTPVMFFALMGFVSLYRNLKSIFWPTFITCILAIYITLSWGHWETGGGLGQRNLIQIYPLLAFPLASVLDSVTQKKTGKVFLSLLILANIYYAGWWLHQAHRGGFFQPGQMTTPYFYSIVGRPSPDRDKFKLLDTREYYSGSVVNPLTLIQLDFEQDSSFAMTDWPDGGKSTLLSNDHKYIGPVKIPVDRTCHDWIRLEADFYMQSREWDVWKYAQWILQFKQGDLVIKSNFIRLQRILTDENKKVHLFFDVRLPDKVFDACEMTIWNADSPSIILVDNLKASCFSQ